MMKILVSVATAWLAKRKFRVSKLLLELGSGVVNLVLHLIWFMKVSPHYNFAPTFLPHKDEFAPSNLTSSSLPLN